MPSKVEIAKVDAKLPVFETSWTEHLDEHKQSILDHKKEFQKTTKDNNVGATWRSNWNIHHTDPRFSGVQTFFEKFVTEIATQYWHTEGQYDCVNMWAMTYGSNEGTKYHNHFPSTMAVIYYVDVKEDSAPICIGETCRPVENGLVIAFPAALDHFVPSDHTGSRICIAANLDHITPSVRGVWKAI